MLHRAAKHTSTSKRDAEGDQSNASVHLRRGAAYSECRGWIGVLLQGGTGPCAVQSCTLTASDQVDSYIFNREIKA